MALATLDYLYCTQDDLNSFLSVAGVLGRVDDENTGSIDAEGQGYIDAAINWATARCNFYLAPKYDHADLATDYVVNEWCAMLAVHWLSIRRGNPAPGSFEDHYKEVLEDLASVRDGTNQLDLGLREAAWPAWSNVRVDPAYLLRKARVERPLSEQGPSGRPSPGSGITQNVDITANWIPRPL